MREQLYALCTPGGDIHAEAVLGFAKSTGLPLRGIALYTKAASPVIERDLDAHRDLGASVREVTYEEASAAITKPGQIPPPRVAINGHIFNSRDEFLREVFPDLALGLKPRYRYILEDASR